MGTNIERLARTRGVAEVEWEDSHTTHGWIDTLPKHDGHAIRSVGYVVQDDEVGVVLTESIDTDETTSHPWGCSMAIPRSAIRKVKYLRGNR